ncbi:hypothetical protein NAL19_1945 [Pectobacterium sp. F1-1]|nr:hypothetical protein NAL19_1945 [Pectobacterium sp. F1-1]
MERDVQAKKCPPGRIGKRNDEKEKRDKENTTKKKMRLEVELK